MKDQRVGRASRTATGSKQGRRLKAATLRGIPGEVPEPRAETGLGGHCVPREPRSALQRVHLTQKENHMSNWKVGTKVQREDFEAGVVQASVIKSESKASGNYVHLRTEGGFEASSPQAFFESRGWAKV